MRLNFLHYELMLHFASHMLLYFALRLILRHKLNLASLRTSPTNNKSEIVLCIHQYVKVIGNNKKGGGGQKSAGTRVYQQT